MLLKIFCHFCFRVYFYLLETKISQVLGQLKSEKAVIVFDQESETCNILRSSDPVSEGIG
ncbi:MAG: YheU family protein [Desulfobacteraceae bacterium]|nr:YheU family protein [Desulfobacteraceae bacterium]